MFRTVALLLCLLFPSVAVAGPIERACLKADRPAATRALCSCIQSVAGAMLSRSEQRQAASFFKDPHKAQEIRQSDRRSHEKFWLRYKEYGQTAAALCSRHS